MRKKRGVLSYNINNLKMANKLIVEKVMTKVEEFYMQNDENSLEAIFNKFMNDNSATFDELDFNVIDAQEMKLEWTELHN